MTLSHAIEEIPNMGRTGSWEGQREGQGVDQPLTVFYVFQPAGTVNFMHHKHSGEK